MVTSDVVLEAESWSRPKWSPGGGDPFLLYVVYGRATAPVADERRRFRTRGLPPGVELRAFHRADHSEYLRTAYEEGYAWEEFSRRDSALAARVSASPGCLVIAGSVADPDSLIYLRDILGMVALLLSSGGVAVYDPITFTWWQPRAWQEKFFLHDRCAPVDHVVTYYSREEQDGFLWFHTRGMRKFGRPDISLHNVRSVDSERAATVCAGLIDYQAFGGVLQEGQAIRSPGLPRFIATHRGGFDDPAFNNVSVELLPE